MTQTSYTDFFQPKIRDDLVFGPPARSGGSNVYHIKDLFTDGFYRVGVREYFLLSQMNGNRTLKEIDEEYALVFGKHLDDRAWGQLFMLLERNQMIANTVDAERLNSLKQGVKQRKKTENRGIFRKRFPLLNPDHMLEKCLSWCRFVFHPAFVFPVLLATIVLQILVLSNLQVLEADAWASDQVWEVLVEFIVLFWLFTAFHEFAHGLACKRFGGSVREMGIVWRYLMFFPYCKVDDVFLFPNRWHRVYTAGAGIFANYLLLLPFGLLWWLTPEKTALRDLCALFLLFFNGATLLNCIPFLEMDGYFMLNHSLNMVHLRKQANQFWRGWLRRISRKQEVRVPPYERRELFVYFVYGFFSFFFIASLFVVLSIFWFTSFLAWLGEIWTLSILLLLVLVALLMKIGSDRYRAKMQR